MNKFDSIELLKQNLNSLVIRYKRAKEEKAELIKEFESLKNENKKLKEEYTELNTAYQKISLAKDFAESLGGTEEAKSKVNKIVREIDRCIALLNR